MRKVILLIYEIFMIVLVGLTIMTIWTQNIYNSTINWVVWGIFFSDFLARFLLAKNKWQFIKHNPFLIIAAVPFDHLFQVGRIVRIIYLFRIKQITKYYINSYAKRLTYQSLGLIVLIVIVFLVVESMTIWQLEKRITFIYEGFYAVFGHLFFFGRQIFIIEHTLSIWLLTMTSILGVIIQGLALQWLFDRVDLMYRKTKEERSLQQQVDRK